MKRCQNCGGVNPDSAEWCGQCHAALGAPVPQAPPPPPPPPAAAPPGAEVPSSPEGAQTAPEARPESGHRRGAFVVTEAGVMWKCAVCAAHNQIEQDICSTCGTPFANTVAPKTEQRRKDGSPSTAALASLVLPGIGHAYLGLWGQAIARGMIGLWVLATIFTALSVDASSSRVMAITFTFVALVLWAVSAHDAAQEAAGRPGAALLKGRMFLWVVLGLLMLMMLQVVSAGLGG